MYKKTWTVAAIAASISSAYASEHIQPLFTSLLPAEQQQVLVSTPLALTTPNLQQINIDTFATKVFATEDKVWLLSDQGVSVLETNRFRFSQSCEVKLARPKHELVW